jgi:hypothetical protein
MTSRRHWYGSSTVPTLSSAPFPGKVLYEAHTVINQGSKCATPPLVFSRLVPNFGTVFDIMYAWYGLFMHPWACGSCMVRSEYGLLYNCTCGIFLFIKVV